MSSLSSHAEFLAYLRDYQRRETRQQWADYYELQRAPASVLRQHPEVISRAEYREKTAEGWQLYQYDDGEIKLRRGARVEVIPLECERQDRLRCQVMGINPSRREIYLKISGSLIPEKIAVMPQSPLNSRAISERGFRAPFL